MGLLLDIRGPKLDSTFRVFANVPTILPIRSDGGSVRIDLYHHSFEQGYALIDWGQVREAHNALIGTYVFADAAITELYTHKDESEKQILPLLMGAMLNCGWHPEVGSVNSTKHNNDPDFQSWIRRHLARPRHARAI